MRSSTRMRRSPEKASSPGALGPARPPPVCPLDPARRPAVDAHAIGRLGRCLSVASPDHPTCLPRLPTVCQTRTEPRSLARHGADAQPPGHDGDGRRAPICILHVVESLSDSLWAFTRARDPAILFAAVRLWVRGILAGFARAHESPFRPVGPPSPYAAPHFLSGGRRRSALPRVCCDGRVSLGRASTVAFPHLSRCHSVPVDDLTVWWYL